MTTHRAHYSGTRAGKQQNLFYSKMHELGIENFYIELVEECPCDNKEQLRAREGYFIRQRGTLNSQIAGRSKQEYHKDTAEHIKQRSHNYYKQNKEKSKETQKQWRETHQEQIKEQKKKWYQEHKNHCREVRDKWNVSVECQCGGRYKLEYKSKHLRSLLHQKYEEQNNT